MLETSTLELQIPSDYLSYRRHLPKELAPFDWLFLSKVIITVYDNEGDYRGCSSLGFKYISVALEVLIQSQTIDIVKGHEQLKKTLGIQQVELGMLNVCHIKSINFDRPYSGVESRLVPPTSHLRRWTFNTQVLRDISGKCVTMTWRRQNDWDMKVSFLRAQCYESIKIFLQYLALAVGWLSYGLILLGYLLFIFCHVHIALQFLACSVKNYQIVDGSNVCLETWKSTVGRLHQPLWQLVELLLAFISPGYSKTVRICAP